MLNKMEQIEQKENSAGGRLLALDAARGLAVVGMYIQHFALNERNAFVSGNTMILFMLCSGISYTLLMNGMERRKAGARTVRTRVLARSVFLDLAGYLILMLNGPFAVVLPAYAMIFLLALPFTRLKTPALFRISGVLFVVCPPLMLIGMSLFSGVALLSDLAGGPLSALAWMPVFVMGMAVGRCKFSETGFLIKMIGAGTLLLLPFKIFSVAVLPGLALKLEQWMSVLPYYAQYEEAPYAPWPHNTSPILWNMLLVDAPQGGSLFELAIGSGGALILIGVLGLAEKRCKAVLKPFSMAGRCALSLYALQFLIAWVSAQLGVELSAFDLGALAAGDLLVAIGALLLGRLLIHIAGGPLECCMKKFERLFL